MSKRGISVLLCAALLTASGCAAQEAGSGKQDGQSYVIYYSALSNEEGESAVEGERRGLGLLIVSHNRPLLQRLCTRVRCL